MRNNEFHFMQRFSMAPWGTMRTCQTPLLWQSETALCPSVFQQAQWSQTSKSCSKNSAHTCIMQDIQVHLSAADTSQSTSAGSMWHSSTWPQQQWQHCGAPLGCSLLPPPSMTLYVLLPAPYHSHSLGAPHVLCVQPSTVSLPAECPWTLSLTVPGHD